MSLLHRTRSASGDLPELTPAQLAELDALDAALAGDDIADPALAALVRDVRAAAPELRPEATQQLNERVAARFAMPGAAGGPSRGRRLLAGYPGQRAGLAATVLIAAAIGLGGGTALLSGGDDVATVSDALVEPSQVPAPATSAPTDQGDSFAYPAAAAGSAASESAQARSGSAKETTERLMPSARSQDATPGASPDRTTNRAVERAVDLAVRVKSGELPSAAADVARITRAANGYVATSQLSLGRVGAGTAALELRVDAARLDRAIDQLSGLGTVTSQNETSRDITSALDGATARLEDANRERRALLAALAKADSAGQIASLRARIAENRRLRARLDADLQRVQRRADLTTIQLTLTAPSKGDPAADDGDWTLSDAASDAWSALRAILGGLLVAAAVSAPFALLSAAGWLIARRRRRAARERALDA